MGDFQAILRRWNKGILRGAQARLAEEAGVDTGTISRWVNGTLMPGEELGLKVAKILGITAEALMAALKTRRRLPEGVTMGEVEHRRGETMTIPVQVGGAAPFPEALRQRIEEEAKRRMITFEMAVVVLLGEYFGNATTGNAGRKGGTIPVEEARVRDREGLGGKTSSGTPDSGEKRGAAARQHRK